jgi:hypothetical protein
LLATLPACLGDSHCAGDAYVQSSTPALQGAAANAWTHSNCTRAEDDTCSASIPPGNALELCQHDPRVATTDGGSFFSLQCHYYSTAKACHDNTGDDEHH